MTCIDRAAGSSAFTKAKAEFRLPKEKELQL